MRRRHEGQPTGAPEPGSHSSIVFAEKTRTVARTLTIGPGLDAFWAVPDGDDDVPDVEDDAVVLIMASGAV